MKHIAVALACAVLLAHTRTEATDVEGLTLPLQPTLTRTGTVVFESRQRSGPNLDGVRLSLGVAGRATSVAALPIVRLEGSRATVRGIPPVPIASSRRCRGSAPASAAGG